MRWGLSLIALLVIPARAQDLVSTSGILDNSVTNLYFSAPTLWVGPYLNVTRDGGATWQAAQIDSLHGLTNSAYSLDIAQDVLWAGLGHQYSRIGAGGQRETINEVRGLLHSTNGGKTWRYVSHLPPNDADPYTTGLLDHPEDTLVAYGNRMLRTLAITVSAQSPPWDIDYDEQSQTLWVAGQLSGIRKSTDDGFSWQRVVLPPDTSRYLAPELNYSFPFMVQPVGIPQDQFHGLNFQAFAVLADETGSVWAGTAGGLNRSDDQGERWHHYSTVDGLSGDWVISIEEQPRPGQSPAIWATTWPGAGEGQHYGVAVTRDTGKTFVRALHGERCYDFAFDGPIVYVACDNALYQSWDNGETFIAIRDFRDANDPARTIRPGFRVFSVEAEANTVWVGTDDGLYRSMDRGHTWRVFRTLVPLSPEGLPSVIPADRVPAVDTYAYPNPFSPVEDRLVRIRYALASASHVTIRVFNFGMNLVRTVFQGDQPGGDQEVSWDGADDLGVRLANGTYFYVVESGSGTFRGKILILE
ncbi:MAG: hypothetical protein OXI38_13210 [Bacteroidota bacterium]|nr:hypothetical protein [Bacteroidota bacterium]